MVSSILAFFVLICVLVFVHEYGHFWAARKCGVKVIRFSIGFGKVLFKKYDKYGTEFAFSLIPLGGYVQMYNSEPELDGELTQSLATKSVWQRSFIVLAGPVANFLFAIVAYWAVFIAGVPTLKPVIGEVQVNSIAAQAKLPEEFEFKSISGKSVHDWEETTLALVGAVGASQVEIRGSLLGEDRQQSFQLDLSHWQINGATQDPLKQLGIRPKSAAIKPIIAQVAKDSAAEQAGIQAGDKILLVNQQPFHWDSLIKLVETGQPLALVIEHQGEHRSLTLQPQKSAKNNRYLIGITPSYQPLEQKYRTYLNYDILTAFFKSIEKVGSLIDTICQFIGKLLSGALSLQNMGGPISMAKGAGATAEIGWVYYLSFMALISVNLGVMNLFPLLPLDGGRLLLLIGEGLLRKPLPEKIEYYLQRVGGSLLLALMLFALFNDIIHF